MSKKCVIVFFLVCSLSVAVKTRKKQLQNKYLKNVFQKIFVVLEQYFVFFVVQCNSQICEHNGPVGAAPEWVCSQEAQTQETCKNDEICYELRTNNGVYKKMFAKGPSTRCRNSRNGKKNWQVCIAEF